MILMTLELQKPGQQLHQHLPFSDGLIFFLVGGA
jgi:hypothetical protein